MIKYLVERPISVIATALLLLILSIINLSYIPTAFLPDIDIPSIKIILKSQNLSAQSIEKQITLPIRQQLANLNNLENLHSKSLNGISEIQLSFKLGADIDQSFFEISEKLEDIKHLLPASIDKPSVIKRKSTAIPAFYINFCHEEINDNNYLNLSRWIRSSVVKRLEKFPEVALIDITGLWKPMIQIQLDRSKLISLQLDEQTIKDAITNNNSGYKTIALRDKALTFNVRFGHQIANIDQLKNIPIKINSRFIKLKQIAKINTLPQQKVASYYYNNSPAVGLAVLLKPGVQTNNLTSRIANELKKLTLNHSKINYQISQNQLTKIDDIINQLKKTLITGCLLAFIILISFIGNWQVAVISCLTIPLSLLITLLFFNLIGININLISLFGLILSLGLMIDNAIIVTDNILQQVLTKNDNISSICTLGATEVSKSLFTSNATTCIIFLPLIILSDLSGALFGNQAVAIGIGLLVSLFTSLILIPCLIVFFNLNLTPKKTNLLETFYHRTYKIFINNKIKTILIIMVFIIFSLITFLNLKSEKLPDLKEKTFVLNIDWGGNISKNENAKRTSSLLKNLHKTLPIVIASIGLQDFLFQEKNQYASQTNIYFKCKSFAQVAEIQNELTNVLNEKWKSATYNFGESENLFTEIFGPNNFFLNARFRPLLDNEEDRSALFARLVKNNVIQKYTNKPLALKLEEQLILRLDLENLLLYEVSMDELLKKLEALTLLKQIGKLKNNLFPVPIVINNESGTLSEILSSQMVLNNRGNSVPLKALLHLKKRILLNEIRADLQGEYFLIPIHHNHQKEAMLNLNSYFTRTKGLRLDFVGGQVEAIASNNKLWVVLAASMLLLYFILTAQFESFSTPFIILLELPISISGAILFISIFNQSLNVMSLVGIVVMCGIVINDSILKIDTINQTLKKQRSIEKAIHSAGIRRIKPMLMTSITTILALIPLFFSESMGARLQLPLAVSIIGGLFIGTLVSVYLIPSAYFMLMNKTRK